MTFNRSKEWWIAQARSEPDLPCTVGLTGEWAPLSQDDAECELLDCLTDMPLPRDDKLLIAELRKRGLWVYKLAGQ